MERAGEGEGEVGSLIREAADALQGWAQSETQYDNVEDDPSWKLANRREAIAGCAARQREDKAATKVAIRPGGVFLVRDGKERRLQSAQRVTVLYDEADTDIPLVRVEFWESDFDGTIEVSESLAAALLSADGQRQPALLTDDDAKALRELMSHDVFATSEEYGRSALAVRRILELLDKRDEIPF